MPPVEVRLEMNSSDDDEHDNSLSDLYGEDWSALNNKNDTFTVAVGNLNTPTRSTCSTSNTGGKMHVMNSASSMIELEGMGDVLGDDLDYSLTQGPDDDSFALDDDLVDEHGALLFEWDPSAYSVAYRKPQEGCAKRVLRWLFLDCLGLKSRGSRMKKAPESALSSDFLDETLM